MALVERILNPSRLCVSASWHGVERTTSVEGFRRERQTESLDPVRLSDFERVEPQRRSLQDQSEQCQDIE